MIITGSNFAGASKVLFGSVATTFTLNSNIQITAVSPGGSGSVHVTVVTPGGTSSTSATDQFTYVFAKPVITGIGPTSGPTAGGTTVIIKGSNFTGTSKVFFGSVAATFTKNSDIQITAISPKGSGTVDVTVTTPGGTSAIGAVDKFTYVPAPVVTAINPTSGPAAGETKVIITGSNFTGASKVLFGSVAATSFTVDSDVQITAFSPVGGTTVHVTVTTIGGTSAAVAADQFTYTFAKPVVASIDPTSGPPAGKTTVVITGSNFTGTSKVLFGSVAASIIAVSDTKITVTSPASPAGPVHVTVTTPGGTSVTGALDLFTYS